MKYQLTKEFAGKFISALRSGNYKQIRHKLFDGSCYCVHGVAMHVCGIPNEQIQKALYASDFNFKTKKNIVELGYPIELFDTQLENELLNMNDSKQMTFAEIADWIEQNVELI